MKKNQLLVAAIIMIVAGALYRLIPYRPLNFAPQLAMAVFGGAVMKDKKLAFALPLFSMLLSDILFQVMYTMNIVETAGFYSGQALNYIFIMATSFIGMAMRKINLRNVAIASVAAPVVYFLLSNFATWAEHGGYSFPLTPAGLFQTYYVAIPFFWGSLSSTIVFSAVFFGIWHFIQSPARKDASLGTQTA